KTTLTVDLAETADAAKVEAALLADQRVAKTRFVPKDENLRQLFVRQGWDLKAMKYLDNPLPDCLIVETTRPEDVPDVVEMASKIKGVTAVHYAQEVALQLLRLIRGVKLTGMVLSVILALAALAVVATTIRLTIYARRREIRIMQLVGATHWFIRLPFLVEGIMYGFASGVLSAMLLLGGYAYLDEQVERTLPFMQLAFGPEVLALLAVGTVVAGMMFGLGGSLLATREYIREV
ncbi:MAG: permease-like cell division protein FtsX, partial [Armatimonadota bacterium]